MDLKAKSNRHIPDQASSSADHSKNSKLPELAKLRVDVQAFRVSLLKLSVRLIKEKRNEYELGDSAIQLTHDIYTKIISFNYNFKMVEVVAQDRLLQEIRNLMKPIELFDSHILCLIRSIKIEQSFKIDNEFDWARKLYSLSRVSTNMIELQDPLTRMSIRKINRQQLMNCRPKVIDADEKSLIQLIEKSEPKILLMLLKAGVFQSSDVGQILTQIQHKLGEAMKSFFLSKENVTDQLVDHFTKHKDETEEACLNFINPELPSAPISQMRTILKILIQCILLVTDTNFELLAFSDSKLHKANCLYPFEDETLIGKIKSIYFDEVVPHVYAMQQVNGVLVEPGTDELLKTLATVLMSVDGDPVAQSMQVFRQRPAQQLQACAFADACARLDQLTSSILEGIWDRAADRYWQNDALHRQIAELNAQLAADLRSPDGSARRLAMAASNFALLYLNLVALMSVSEEAVKLRQAFGWFALLEEYLKNSPPVVKNALLMKREWQLLARLSQVYPEEVVVLLSQVLHQNPTVYLSDACCLTLVQFLRQSFAQRFDNGLGANLVAKKMLVELMMQLLENTQQVDVKVRYSKDLYDMLLPDQLYSLRYLLGVSEVHQEHDLARPPLKLQTLAPANQQNRSTVNQSLDFIHSTLLTFNHICRYNKPDLADFQDCHVDNLAAYARLYRLRTGPLFLAEIVKLYSHLYIRNNIDYNDLVILDESADDEMIIQRSMQNVRQLEHAVAIAEELAKQRCDPNYLELFVIRGVLESLYKLITLTIQSVPRSKYSSCDLFKIFNLLKASSLQLPSILGFKRVVTDDYMKVYEELFNSIIDGLENLGGAIEKATFSRRKNTKPVLVSSSKGMVYDSISKLGDLLTSLELPLSFCEHEHSLYDLYHEASSTHLADQVQSTGNYSVELMLEAMHLKRSPVPIDPDRGSLLREAEAYKDRKRAAMRNDQSHLHKKLEEPSDEDKVAHSLLVYLAFSSLSSFNGKKYTDKIDKMLKFFYCQPTIIYLVEILSNCLMLKGSLIRPFINGRFFGQEAVDEEDEARGAETAGHKHSKQSRAKTGRQLFDHLMHSIAFIQYVINQSYQNDLITAHSNIYYQLCYFVKSLVEENYEQFKTEFQKSTMEVKMMTYDRQEQEFKPIVITLSCISLMMKGLAHPRELPRTVVMRKSIVDDRHELLVFNYVSVVTLSELIFGVDSQFMRHSFDKKFHKLAQERFHMTVNHHIKHMLLWSNILDPNVDSPSLKLREELARYLSYLFEHNKSLVDSVLDGHLGKDCDIRVTPTLIYNQVVSHLALLYLSHTGKTLNPDLTDPFSHFDSANSVDEHALKKVYNKKDSFSKHPAITIARLLYRLMKIFKSSDKNRQFALFLEKLDQAEQPTTREKAGGNRFDSWTYKSDPIAARRKGEVFYRFLKLVSGAVEVKLKNDALMIVDFPILPECFMITSNSKKEFMENVPVGDHGAKLVRMMEEVVNFEIEGAQNKELADNYKLIGAIVTNDAFEWMMITAWLISVLMNVIALIYYDFHADRPRNQWYWAFNAVCNLVVLGWCSAMGLIYLLAKTKENYKKRLRRAFEEIAQTSNYAFVKRALYCFAFCRDALQHQTIVTVSALHILFALLYLAGYQYFLPWHLLLGINLSKPAKYVMKSITVHYNQIVWTLSLVAIVIYLYALLIFLFFRNQFDEGITEGSLEVCPSLGVCYGYVVDLGLRNGGGIADVMKLLEFSSPSFFPKFVLNVSFFIFINIVSLNIVFGIITDTFDQLRKESVERGRPC